MTTTPRTPPSGPFAWRASDLEAIRIALSIPVLAASLRGIHEAMAMHLHYHGDRPRWCPMATVQPNLRGSLHGVESTLTDRYQTTVPQEVRRVLGLQKRDRIRYAFRPGGEVVLERSSPGSSDDDPALAPFLALVERDIAAHPERLRPVSADLAARLEDLVGGMEIDLDVRLEPEEEGDVEQNA